MNLNDRYVGQIIDLFSFDFRRQGGGVVYITNNSDYPNDIVWDGVLYTPSPVLLEALSNAVKGTSPQPIVKVGNINGILDQQVRLTRDLVGGVITRTRVFSENLDDGDNPSTTPIYPPEFFYINSSYRNKTEVTLRTSTQLGAFHPDLPAMRVTADRYPGIKRIF